MTDLDITPKKNERTKLRRSYAIPDIAALVSDAAESEHGLQEPNDEYEPKNWPESQDAADEDFAESDDDPTPKKRQKTVKAAVRDVINANRKEQEPRKAENKVSHFIVY